MTLADHLQTPQAREDVRHMLSCGVPSAQWFSATKTRISEFKLGAWIRILITAERHSISACYRPDGDRFVVTDLGEGVRALRLKGCALLDIKPKVDEVLMQMYQAGLLHPNYGPAALIQGEIGTIGNVTAADLPDAICRVMLASLKVSEVQP